MRPLQLTLAIFKPDVSAQPHIVKEIKKILLTNSFYFVRSKELYLPRKRAEEFYKEHEGRFFHNRLVSFMSSGEISAHIMARDNAIKEWRKLMGPTKVFQTVHSDPNSIRGQFGLTDTRNSTHGSDSEESARKEMQFFFPEFNVDQWYKEKEPYFQNGNVSFYEEKGIHVEDIPSAHILKQETS
ncbi:nucleoside diphosphate kinase 6-like [Ylistrum balloti]|uniref:nucleoside diphosphate kinase 6-like n=1 Tax=Ylistrum balloti TaxID=509963 RepID=UPI002905E3D3|nr:nucleoside diphosphate kinase 6-like [Ylistrum balloti]